MTTEAPAGPSVVDASMLETHKENIVPSREGRNALAISQVYSVPRAQRNKELAATHAQYRERIDSLQDEDAVGDPMDAYCEYITWIIDNYPSGSSSESGLLSILEEATRRFSEETSYKNDLRYVRLWMEYANLVEQSERVYAYMLANDIGTVYPHMYDEYALILERNRNLSKADKIYRLAIARRVQDLGSIKLRYKEFQARCLAETSTSNEPPPLVPPPTRAPLGGRTILGSRTISRSQSTPQPTVPRTPAARSNLGKIAVFVDSDQPPGDAQTNEWPNLQTKSEAVKENKASATDGALHQRPVVPHTPKVAIFRDAPTTPGPSTFASTGSPEQVFRPRSVSANDERSKDPLRNFGKHCKFELELPELDLILNKTTGGSRTAIVPPPTSLPDPNKASSKPPPEESNSRPPLLRAASGSNPSSSSTRQPTSSSSKWSGPLSACGPKPMPTLPKPQPGKRPEIMGFSLDVFWRDGEEYSVWETRASNMGLLNKKWPDPPIEELSDTENDADADADAAVPTKEEDGEGRAVSKSRGNTSTSRMSIAKNRRSTLGRNINSSPTTNTKAALSDVFDMFNETARLDDLIDQEDEEEEGDGVEDEPVAPMPPKTPIALNTSGKTLSWTPLVESGTTPAPAPVSQLRSLATPLQPRQALGAKTPMFEIARDPAPPSSTKTPGPKFAVFQEGATPAAQPRTALSSVTPTPKFAVFQDNGEKRLPSIAKSGLGTAPFGQKTTPSSVVEPPTQGVTSAVEETDKDQVVPATLSIHSPGIAQSAKETLSPNHHLHSTPPTQSDASPAPPQDDTLHSFPSHPHPLIFKESESSTRPIPIVQRYDLSTEIDVFGNDVFSDEVEGRAENIDNPTEDEESGTDGRDVETAEEDESLEEEDYDVDDIRPRSYEMRGGVAIMTPITERTLEYETQSRASLATTSGRRSSVASTGRILEGLEDASPAPKRRSSRVSLSRRRSSIRPRTSIIPEGIDEEEEELFQDAQEEAINPFTAEVTEGMLDAIWDTLDLGHYRDLQTVESSHLVEFEAFLKKHGKSKLGRSRSDAPFVPMTFELDLAEYALLDKIGEGGFGAVFLAEDMTIKELVTEDPESYSPGYELVAIKTVSPGMLWEFAILHVLRGSLPADALRSIIAPRDFYHFANESHLVMDYSGQGTLLDVVNRASQMGVNAQDTSGIDELLIMFFTIELLRLVRYFHGEHFIHGDLKIDNCLLRLADPASFPLDTTYDHSGEGGWSERGVKLIDFGRTIDVGLFDPGQQFIGDWPADSRDCIEMQEGRPWSYQTDYAGLAGIIYCMMFGKFVETVASTNSDGTRTFRVATPLKRYWQTDIWNRLYNVLLNPCQARHDGTLPLVDELSEIEDEMADWLTQNCEKKGKSLKRMLNHMYQFTKSQHRRI